jgi:SAM-dependent methyltransferase
LEQLGWTVHGIDVSPLALKGAQRRLEQLKLVPRGWLAQVDATDADFGEGIYDLVISYGLYHCLSDDGLRTAHGAAMRALRAGGLFAFAVFNDSLPIPPNHCTSGLVLRSVDYVPNLLKSCRRLALEVGEIEEAHPPLVPRHRHSLTWGLFESPQ